MNIKTLLNINNLNSNPSMMIEKLEKFSVQDLYQATLKVQMDLNISEVLRYLFNNTIWKSANSVLDLGCGTGDLILHLMRYFPDKFYTGIDINEAFIKNVKEHTKDQKICEFYCEDLYKFSKGRYDFVVLRAVLQHLKDIDGLLKHLPNLLKKNSVVVFNDTTKENFITASPKIPTFDEFYDELEIIQKKHDGNRDCISELEEKLADSDFRLIEAQNQIMPITTEENKIKIAQYLILGCTVTKKMLPIHIELKNLITDILKWYHSNAPYIQFKTKWLMIKMN